jgi:hypothetical protein
MTNGTDIHPSADARQLFSKMVARAEDSFLALDQTIALSVERRQQGRDPACCQEIDELVSEGWLTATPDGGWRVDSRD